MSYVNNLKTFVRVYDLGSISAAGRDIRVSAAVASNRIAELEKHLGVRLFNRTTRSLKPTEQGIAFYKGAIKILDTIEEVESGIAETTSNPKGTLFISAPLGMGKRLIAPMVPEFKERYPELNVRLRLTDRRVDLTTEGIDAAFVLGNQSDSEMRIKPVHEFERVLCASPEYVSKYGLPANGEDINSANHQCLMLRYPGAVEFFWNLQLGDKVKRYDFDSPLESDDGDVLTGWALAGSGIVNKTRYEVMPYLETGELVEVASQTPPTNQPFSCIYPHKRLQDIKVRLFIDYSVERCRKLLGA
jgi:DNA-binding transcriptional LysR family regulator